MVTIRRNILLSVGASLLLAGVSIRVPKAQSGYPCEPTNIEHTERWEAFCPDPVIVVTWIVSFQGGQVLSFNVRGKGECASGVGCLGNILPETRAYPMFSTTVNFDAQQAYINSTVRDGVLVDASKPCVRTFGKSLEFKAEYAPARNAFNSVYPCGY